MDFLSFNIESRELYLKAIKKSAYVLYGLFLLELILCIVNICVIKNNPNTFSSVLFGCLVGNMIWVFYSCCDTLSDLKLEKQYIKHLYRCREESNIQGTVDQLNAKVKYYDKLIKENLELQKRMQEQNQ